MGAVRDQKDRTVWRWTGSGDEVSVSFWSLPQGTEEDCARYDGSRGWLWSDTPCTARLNFICQHRKDQLSNVTSVFFFSLVSNCPVADTRTTFASRT